MVSPWLVGSGTATTASHRLIAIPWAGAGAAALLPWRARLGPDTELVVVRLPGRESRFTEPRLTSIDEVVAGLLPAIRALAPLPTVLFGYSLGALIAFELARSLESCAAPVDLLAVGGSAAPHRLPGRERIAGLDDDRFAAAVRELDGTSNEIFDHPELLQLLLPLLRADFAMLENYRPMPGMSISCPISTFTGRSDPELHKPGVDAWADLTTGPVTHHRYDGGHFFLLNDSTSLLADLRADIRRHLNR